MAPLYKDIQKTIEDLHAKYHSLNEGTLADYIPELARANPNHFAIAVVTIDGEIYKVGDVSEQFTLQSTSKPFVYGLAREELGEDYILSKVGVEPTGDAFNSLIELEEQSHRPYNPMINSGAIAISSFIRGKQFDERLNKIINLFESYVGHSLDINDAVFLSEKKTAHRNRAIAHLLKHFGIIEDDFIDESLDLYFKQCSIMVNTQDLASIASTLASGGIQPITKKQIITTNTARDILSLMFTCGMYDSAGEWAFKVGVPAKSGVSGGLLAAVPGKMGIAVYSPLIDKRGHSVRAVKVMQELSKKYSLSVFSIGAM
ncbi:MAG: glutaminase A [Bacteriovorax sp.]|nr:glutaminase A [Bacteriovorax sp.]